MEAAQLKQQATEAIRFLHSKGWAPATSSNYSFRLPGESSFYISQSGVDKGAFLPEHFMLVDNGGNCIEQPPRRPSAETLIHVWLYRQFPAAGCILHTHSLFNTLLSARHLSEGGIAFSGLELLKAVGTVKTHLTSLRLPILPNTQDMQQFSLWLSDRQAELAVPHAFLIAGHGLYAWGTTIAEARRHIEAWEFLLELKYHQALYDAALVRK